VELAIHRSAGACEQVAFEADNRPGRSLLLLKGDGRELDVAKASVRSSRSASSATTVCAEADADLEFHDFWRKKHRLTDEKSGKVERRRTYIPLREDDNLAGGGGSYTYNLLIHDGHEETRRARRM
jgi:hypothetical protein